MKSNHGMKRMATMMLAGIMMACILSFAPAIKAQAEESASTPVFFYPIGGTSIRIGNVTITVKNNAKPLDYINGARFTQTSDTKCDFTLSFVAFTEGNVNGFDYKLSATIDGGPTIQLVSDWQHSDNPTGEHINSCELPTIPNIDFSYPPSGGDDGDQDNDDDHHHHHHEDSSENYSYSDTDTEGTVGFGVTGPDGVWHPANPYYIKPEMYKKFNTYISNHSIFQSEEPMTIHAEPWTSMTKEVADSFTQNSKADLTIIYAYEGSRYAITIPAGTDLSSLVDENGYLGFAYLATLYPTVELE